MTTETESTTTDVDVAASKAGDDGRAWSPPMTDGVPPPYDGPAAPGASDAQPASAMGRMVGIVVAAVVAVVAVGAIVAVWTTGNGSNALKIPSSPPGTLLGQRAAPHAVAQNSDWSSLASQVAQGSTVSFANVYGPYPPPSNRTTATFLVVAGQVRGGNRDIPTLMRQEVSGVTSSISGRRDAKVVVGSLHTSVLGGQMQCVSASETRPIVGECLWLDPEALVQVVTFSDHLPTVEGMTTHLVDELHSGRFS